MFSAFGQPISALELVASASGLASVWLAQRMHAATWPAGMVSVVCFAAVFYGARLYADAVLQLAFVVLAAYGWWRWSRGGTEPAAAAATRATPAEIALALPVCAAGTWAVAGWLMHRTDSPAPWPDAAIFVLSLLATWAQARRRIECWAVWIAVDLIAVPLYWSRGLPLSTGLYLVFMLLCLRGWIAWERRLR
jgi:nicotinamide mononucleotide transporter